jgi:hypothetical protein
MNRSALILLGAAALAACGDLGIGNGTGSLAVSPVLDSVFVGDRSAAHHVTYVDAQGNVQPSGPVTWASSDTTLAQVNANGVVTGVKRGAVLITATAQGLTAGSLMVVSDTLDITLQMDTVYVLPGDTLTVPVVVLKRNPNPAATVWFNAPNQSEFSIDSASGRITALAAGGPARYIVHANTLADTGAVYVMSLTDTTGGKMFFSVAGTVISHVGGSAGAANYVATGGHLAFQLRASYNPTGNTAQIVQITLLDSLTAADSNTVFSIDSLNPLEDTPGVGGSAAVCSPPRAWALWEAQSRRIFSYSRPGGTLGVTQVVTIPNGQAVSGRFRIRTQRTDLQSDPLGALLITGSFVVPLVRSTSVCR